MDRAELIRELDRIIDVGIVNAKHDSDVLRHIRKLLQDPVPKKVLTVEELKQLPAQTIVWIEYWNGEEKKADPDMIAAMKCYDGTLVDEDASVYNDFERDMTPDRFDGSCWRFWLGKPTDEQRKAVKWNGA